MTPEQIDQVRSVIALVRDRPEFAAGFYGRLFEAAPRTSALFADIEAQQRKLTDELDAMVDLLGDLGALEERAGALGGRHRAYGVRASHYRLARTAMFDTLVELLGDDFGPAERAAWERATSLITELMQTP